MKYKVMMNTGAFGRRSKDVSVNAQLRSESEKFDEYIAFFGSVQKAFAAFSGVVDHLKGKTPTLDELLRNEYIIDLSPDNN